MTSSNFTHSLLPLLQMIIMYVNESKKYIENCATIKGISMMKVCWHGRIV